MTMSNAKSDVSLGDHNLCATDRETEREKWHYQIDKDTHVLLGQPVEEVSRVAGQNFIVMECRDGLDALL